MIGNSTSSIERQFTCEFVPKGCIPTPKCKALPLGQIHVPRFLQNRTLCAATATRRRRTPRAPLPQAATRAMPRRQSRRRWRPPSPWCRRGLSCSGSPSAGHGARHAAAYIYDAEASKLEERSPQHAAARRTVRRPPAAASMRTASAAATPASSIRTSTLCPKFCKTCPTILRPFTV